jgi:hypothetical protein
VLGSIVADWKERDAQIRSARFEWQIERHCRSATFGALSDRVESGVAADGAAPIRMQFDSHSFRMDGHCPPTVRLLERVWGNSVPTAGLTRDEKMFHFVREARFAKGDFVEKSQPYTLVSSPDREVHRWDEAVDGYPRAIVLPPHSGNRPLEAGTSGTSSLPLMAALLDALRLALRPSLGSADDGDGGDGHVVPENPVVDGAPCIVAEESPAENGARGARRLWIDPARGGLVLRSRLPATETADEQQCDIEYDRDEAGTWLPSRMTVVRINATGDVSDSIAVARRSVVFNENLHADAFAVNFPAGTWVTDHIAGEQFYVNGDGTRRKLSAAEALSGITHAELQSGDAAVGGARSNRGERWRRYVARMLTWPGILVTLPAAIAIFYAGRGLIRRGASHV